MNNENNKNENNKQKKRNAKIAKIVAICMVFGVFASAIVGLSVALYYAETSVRVHETYQRQMDAVYKRAYYDLMDGASDLGVTLRKISVSNSPSMQQSLLYEVWNNAQLAEGNLSVFSTNDDGILKAQQFVNQLGDFSHSLALKIARGEKLSVEDRLTLQKLGEIADVYSNALVKVQQNLDDGLEMTDMDAMDTFVGAFEEFGEPSFDYPEMIYDGPFSSALDQRRPKGLIGKDITPEIGVGLLKKYLPNATDIEFVSESEGNIVTLDYSLKIAGVDGYAQLAKKGGMLILLTINDEQSSEHDTSISQTGYDMVKDLDNCVMAVNQATPTCQQKALSFVSALGLENMQVVWSCMTDSECVVNLAPVQNGAVLYPDLVKVKLSRNNAVIGFDSSHYAYNHVQRQIPSPSITAEQARENLSLTPVSNGKLALIPLRETREVLTYEFECESDGTYYVYIDATTGDEVNILYVISDEMGERTV